MTLSEKAKLLRSSVLFRGLSEDAVLDAAQLAEPRDFARAQLLLSSGERHVGVIVSGYAKVVKPSADGSVTMSLLGSGDVFGAASLMGGRLPSTEVKAIKPLTALIFSEESFLYLMEKHFALTQSYCRYFFCLCTHCSFLPYYL